MKYKKILFIDACPRKESWSDWAFFSKEFNPKQSVFYKISEEKLFS